MAKSRCEIDKAKQARKQQANKLDKEIDYDNNLLKELQERLLSDNDGINIGDFYEIEDSVTNGVFVVEAIYPTYAKLRNIITGYCIGQRLWDLQSAKKLSAKKVDSFTKGYFKTYVLDKLLGNKRKAGIK